MTIMSYWNRFVCLPIGLGDGNGAAEHVEGHCAAEALQHNATQCRTADPRRAHERVRDHAPIRLPCPQGATRGWVAGVTPCGPTGVCRGQQEGEQVCPAFTRPVHLAGSV